MIDQLFGSNRELPARCFRLGAPPSTERRLGQQVRVFPRGDIFRTYSAGARGNEEMFGA